MKIAYIGSGYVGQVNAAGAANYGHEVILVDIIPEKVDSINSGKPTIYEEGLNELLHDLVIKRNTLKAYLDIEKAVLESELSFICVGTPDKGGMIDLSYIQEVAKQIGKALKNKQDYHVVIVKSTVIPGTTMNTVRPLLEKFSGKKCFTDFGLAMNPEFLREGVALDDCLKPDSIVLGTQDEKTLNILKKMYDWASSDIITQVGITAAEAIKYAKNTFLALKITFANEWANFCDNIGIDSLEVMEAIGKDKRISPLFLRNGPGYGGSCFPKDVNAIIHAGQINHSEFRVLEEVVNANKIQYIRLLDLAKKEMGALSQKKVGILGLSFKPNTDDTRESPALKLIAYLVSIGCNIQAYCPQGIKMAKKWLDANRIEISYSNSSEECIKGVEFVMIPTDWAEFREIIPKITVPTFIGHRTLVDPTKYDHVQCLGYPTNKRGK
jgi:UDPglucose 6-dehydrogenase